MFNKIFTNTDWGIGISIKWEPDSNPSGRRQSSRRSAQCLMNTWHQKTIQDNSNHCFENECTLETTLEHKKVSGQLLVLKDLNDSKLIVWVQVIPMIIQDQFYSIQNLQRSPIPKILILRLHCLYYIFTSPRNIATKYLNRNIQVNEWDSSIVYSIKPKLDIGCLLISVFLPVFTCSCMKCS